MNETNYKQTPHGGNHGRRQLSLRQGVAVALLLALCGNKQELSVRQVPLGAAASEAVAEAFSTQEATFRDGQERPFDENWLTEADEIATAPIPPDIRVFDTVTGLTDTEVEPVDAENLDDVRGLSIKFDDGDTERILVQVFAASQALSRPWLVSLLYEAGTYTRLESPGFRLADKLVCIVEDGMIKFRSLHNLGRVIDTSAIFSAATDGDILTFADEHSNLFDIADIDNFLDSASRNARKYMASLANSGVLQDHNAHTLQEASAGTHLTIEVQNNRIIMPESGGDITELMRFLNDGRYVGTHNRQRIYYKLEAARRVVPLLRLDQHILRETGDIELFARFVDPPFGHQDVGYSVLLRYLVKVVT